MKTTTTVALCETDGRCIKIEEWSLPHAVAVGDQIDHESQKWTVRSRTWKRYADAPELHLYVAIYRTNVQAD
jgi:hypothetical protein